MKKLQYVYSRKNCWKTLTSKLIISVGYYKIKPEDYFEVKDMLLKLKPVEFPKIGEHYCYIDDSGDVDGVTFYNNEDDQWRKANNNTFKTKEEAEKRKEEILGGKL